MKFFLILSLLCYSIVNAEEVSVFGAGDLKLAKPYGLTSAEKTILDNKSDLNKVDNKLSTMNIDFNSLIERIDGIESIFQGDNRKLKSVDLKYDEIQKEISLLKLSVSDLENKNKELNLKLENIVKKLESIVKSIESNYVSRKEFDELVVFINKQVKPVKKKSSKKKVKKKQTNKELLKEAHSLFKEYYFKKAIPIYESLIKENYRPAECNFYLGEIYYYRKQYKDAVHKFKLSMGLYDKASYIPKLLLHSAISFEKIDDLDNAANFYATLIDVYPQTDEAKEAQKSLEKIN